MGICQPQFYRKIKIISFNPSLTDCTVYNLFLLFAHPEFRCFRCLCLREIETFNIHYQFMDILNWKVVSSSIMKRSPCTSFSSNICTICSTVILPFPLASFFRNCSSSFLCRSASRRLLAKLNILTASGSQPRRKKREKKSEDGLGQVSYFMPHGQLVLLSLGQPMPCS